MIRVFVPRDSAARSVGADEVAAAIAKHAKHLGLQIIRNGSRGLFWLEPLVEVETPSGPHRLWPRQRRRRRLAVRREVP